MSIHPPITELEIKLETYPALLEPSPVKTEVMIALVEEDLMIGIIAYDPEPEKIQAPFRDRDSITSKVCFISRTSRIPTI